MSTKRLFSLHVLTHQPYISREKSNKRPSYGGAGGSVNFKEGAFIKYFHL